MKLFDFFLANIDLTKTKKTITCTWSCISKEVKDGLLIGFETPLITRNIWREPPEYNGPTQHYRIGLNDLTCFDKASYCLPLDPSNKRYNELLVRANKKLGLMKEDTGKGHLVYVLQMWGDGSLGEIDQFEKAFEDLSTIKSITARKVFVVLHPNYFSSVSWYKDIAERSKKKVERLREHTQKLGYSFVKGPSSQYFEGCDVVITYSSGTGYEALEYGIPTIALLTHSYVYSICKNSLFDLRDQIVIDEKKRNDWFSKLAYCEWSLEEIQNGTVVDHFKEILYK